MARSKSSGNVKDVWEEKEWYNLKAPDIFAEQDIGETPANNPEDVMGRTVEVNLSDLTGDLSKNYVKVKLQVNEVKGDNAFTKFKGHEISRSYLRSKTRRGSSKVDERIDVKLGDKKLRLTASAMAIRVIHEDKKKEIRRIMKETIKEKSEDMEMGQFIQEMVLERIASDVYKKATKIYPVRMLEIVKSKVIKEE